MAKQRDGRNQDSEDRYGNGNGNHKRIVTVSVMGFGEFDTLMHFAASSLWNYAEASAAMTFSDSTAAATVRSISPEVCAVETKAASNCDGARKMPRSSISRKKRAYRLVSERFASA